MKTTLKMVMTGLLALTFAQTSGMSSSHAFTAANTARQAVVKITEEIANSSAVRRKFPNLRGTTAQARATELSRLVSENPEAAKKLNSILERNTETTQTKSFKPSSKEISLESSKPKKSFREQIKNVFKRQDLSEETIQAVGNAATINLEASQALGFSLVGKKMQDCFGKFQNLAVKHAALITKFAGEIAIKSARANNSPEVVREETSCGLVQGIVKFIPQAASKAVVTGQTLIRECKLWSQKLLPKQSCAATIAN